MLIHVYIIYILRASTQSQIYIQIDFFYLWGQGKCQDSVRQSTYMAGTHDVPLRVWVHSQTHQWILNWLPDWLINWPNQGRESKAEIQWQTTMSMQIKDLFCIDKKKKNKRLELWVLVNLSKKYVLSNYMLKMVRFQIPCLFC